MIERFIGYESNMRGKAEHYEAATVEQMQKTIDNYLDDYHHIRPHERLDFLTLAQEKCAIFGKAFLTAKCPICYEHGQPH